MLRLTIFFLSICVVTGCGQKGTGTLSGERLDQFIENFHGNKPQFRQLIEWLSFQSDGYYGLNSIMPDSIRHIAEGLSVVRIFKEANRTKNAHCETVTNYTFQIGKEYEKPFVYYVKDKCDLQKVTNNSTSKIIDIGGGWLLVNTTYDWFWD